MKKIVKQIQQYRMPLKDSGVSIWDLFYPSFTCPFTVERLGRVGDGGKWVCGFLERVARKSPCLIYSFGIGEETTFEEEILQRTTDCTIRMFDHTIQLPPLLVQKYPGRAFWYPLGISNETSDRMRTLKNIMDANRDESIDVLKIDTEGAEWDSLRQVLKDFPNTLPFSQLLLEIHLAQRSDTGKARFFLDFSKTLEDAGLRIFHSELNYGSMESHAYSEFSFLNLQMLGWESPDKKYN